MNAREPSMTSGHALARDLSHRLGDAASLDERMMILRVAPTGRVAFSTSLGIEATNFSGDASDCMQHGMVL